jgi:hypothetical protein
MENPQNITSGYFPIKPLVIEERPLLDFPEATQLAAMAVIILILGTLVQVSIINQG